MPNLKDIKTRIVSVKKTKQITSAMKLVAGAKLKRATDAATNAKPYKEQLEAVLSRVAARADDVEEPLLTPRDNIQRIALVVIASDRGLCGGFNNALLRKTVDWIEAKQAEGIEVELHAYGRKAFTFLAGRGYARKAEVGDLNNGPKMDFVRPLSDAVVTGFVSGHYDAVYVASNEFKSVLTQEPTFSQLIPLTVDTEAAGAGGDYRYEPGADEILGALLPLYIRTILLQQFLETEAGEHAARMTAMDAATRNASELIDSLTLAYNRARQAAITTEIIEIVSGAAAL